MQDKVISIKNKQPKKTHTEIKKGSSVIMAILRNHPDTKRPKTIPK
jgi:hypothetical protein